MTFRVDFFKHPKLPGRFFLNEVEGFESQLVGKTNGKKNAESPLHTRLNAFWFEVIRKLVNNKLSIKE